MPVTAGFEKHFKYFGTKKLSYILECMYIRTRKKNFSTNTTDLKRKKIDVFLALFNIHSQI